MPNPLALLPYALAAYGGYRGYRSAKDSGQSGIGRLLGTAAGAYTGYQLGSMVPGVPAPVVQPSIFAQPRNAATLGNFASRGGGADMATATMKPQSDGGLGSLGSLTSILKKGGDADAEFSPGRVSAAIAAGSFLSGAFDPAPVDIYQPTYNLAYADFAAQRPGFTYIDPATGQEKVYEKVYIPEADPKNQGALRVGPYAMEKTRLKTGGLAEIKKFNEGGVNYLPSKMTHDENDANNYVRASGYVEDGAGVGDKDEDTMLAQLADGEFVTRADGVLGAGIIAGGNPSSMKDMREKGAKYFYEQQARYKRVFDLLKDKNGNSSQKTN